MIVPESSSKRNLTLTEIGQKGAFFKGLLGDVMNLRYLLSAVFGTLLIVYLSSIPHVIPWMSGFPGEEIILNLGHIPAYGLVTFLWISSFPAWENGKRYSMVIGFVLVGLVLFGISDEIHQSFVPGRMPSIMDLGFDTIGILSGLGAFHAVKRMRVALQCHDGE